MIIGQLFTEQPHLVMYKDNASLRFLTKSGEELCLEGSPPTKSNIWAKDAVIMPSYHVGHVVCRMEVQDEVFVNLSIRSKAGQEHCVPRCIVSPGEEDECIVPVMNLSDQDLLIKKNRVLARGRSCNLDETVATISTTGKDAFLSDVLINQSLTAEQRRKLLDLLKEYSDCFSNHPMDIGSTTGE